MRVCEGSKNSEGKVSTASRFYRLGSGSTKFVPWSTTRGVLVICRIPAESTATEVLEQPPSAADW
jgi:hypothetical protein